MSPWAILLPSADIKKQREVWVIWISQQWGQNWLFLNLKQNMFKWPRTVTPKHCNKEFLFLFFVFVFVFTSHFIIGDSGNLLCSCRTNDPGKNEEKSCWLVCVCVCMFWWQLWHLSFSLHSIRGPANLCYVPFMPLCSASGKVCITAAEGLRRRHGGIAHAPQHTCPECPSQLSRSESNKIHVFKTQTSNTSWSCWQATSPGWAACLG